MRSDLVDRTTEDEAAEHSIAQHSSTAAQHNITAQHAMNVQSMVWCESLECCWCAAGRCVAVGWLDGGLADIGRLHRLP